MVALLSEFAAFITEPPAVHIREGIAVVRHKGESGCVERAMSIRTLERSIERGQLALKRYAAGETDIIVDS